MVLAVILKQFYLLFFGLGVVIAQTGGILHTELMTLKQYLQEDRAGVSFHASAGFIEEMHPTMRGMQRITLKNVVFDKKDSDLGFIKTIKMTCSKKMLENIKPMDSVRVFGSLLKFKNPIIPGGFDQIQYNTIMGIDANGVVFAIKKSKTQIKHDFTEIFSSIRFRLTKAVSAKIKGEASGIAVALLTGDKSAIKPDIRNNFIKSGIAHILAISGLHMSLVAGILFCFARRILLYLNNFTQNFNTTVIAVFVTIPFAFLYLALSGFSPSATRAFIMTALCLISMAAGKKALSLKNISIAALLILIFDPFSLFHLSFQLSFSAVVALIAFYENFQDKLQQMRMNKFLRYLFFSVLTTIIATIATTPLSVAAFNRFSAQNILGNFVAIPITGCLIVPLGIINIFMGKFTDLFIKPLEMSINLMINAASYIASLPGTEIALKTPDTLMLYTGVFGGTLLCLMKTPLKHIGSFCIICSVFHYAFLQKIPVLIAVPGENNIFCEIRNGKIYANSKQKARNKIKAIAKNLGLRDERIHKAEIPEIPPETFIWKNGETAKLSAKTHPVCPVRFIKTPHGNNC